MNTDATAEKQTSPKQRTTMLVGLLAVAGMFGWLQWRVLASTRDTYATALGQLNQMRTDARRIETLRETPRAAVGRSRANEELLAQVEQSLAAAGMDRTKWHDSIPQPPVRLSNSDYKRLSTRLYFEDVTLKELAAFAYDLQSSDPTLRVSAVNLTNRHPDSPEFDVDVAISYRVFAPQVGGRGP